jgi:hypothetical protein
VNAIFEHGGGADRPKARPELVAAAKGLRWQIRTLFVMVYGKFTIGRPVHQLVVEN